MANVNQPYSPEPWKNLGWGVLVVAASVVLFRVFASAEAEGGTIRLPVILAFPYRFIGKWGTCGLIALMGIALIGFAIAEFKEKYQDKR